VRDCYKRSYEIRSPKKVLTRRGGEKHGSGITPWLRVTYKLSEWGKGIGGVLQEGRDEGESSTNISCMRTSRGKPAMGEKGEPRKKKRNNMLGSRVWLD